MIILANKGEENECIEKEKNKWIAGTLQLLNIHNIENTYNYKQLLIKMGVSIWEDTNHNIEILQNNNLVAQWKEPKMILINDKEGLYYKIYINTWVSPIIKK